MVKLFGPIRREENNLSEFVSFKMRDENDDEYDTALCLPEISVYWKSR
jgi:hypothetical protein